MPERASIAQVVQLGAETVPGTLVPALKRIQSMMIEPDIDTDIQLFRGLVEASQERHAELTAAPAPAAPAAA